jgi:hypothetical protein
MHGLGDRPSRQ